MHVFGLSIFHRTPKIQMPSGRTAARCWQHLLEMQISSQSKIDGQRESKKGGTEVIEAEF